jgi:hypothetical protein
MLPMPNNACWIIDGSPTLSPCSEAEIKVLAISWIEESIKSTEFYEFKTINSHETAGGKECVAEFLA